MDKYYRKLDSLTEANRPRSTDPNDYQDLSQNLAVMLKVYPDAHYIPPHNHPRDQLIFATSGVMRVGTNKDAWVVPPDRALLLPAGVVHSVKMHGGVTMHTLYISPSEPGTIKVLCISPILRELIAALGKEPMDYSGDSRAELIATLISMEMDRADALPLNIPLPRDSRLQRLCQILIHDPSIDVSLEGLAANVGASAKTLARLCYKEFSMGLSEWRRRVRFAKAFELLEQGQPVKQVARSCGYASASAFTFAFRRKFGAPPSEFQV